MLVAVEEHNVCDMYMYRCLHVSPMFMHVPGYATSANTYRFFRYILLVYSHAHMHAHKLGSDRISVLLEWLSQT